MVAAVVAERGNLCDGTRRGGEARAIHRAHVGGGRRSERKFPRRVVFSVDGVPDALRPVAAWPIGSVRSVA